MDSEKQQRTSNILSILSNTPWTKHIEQESNAGKDEFSRIAENEKKRVQQVVDAETKRILQEKRSNGTIRVCPICLEEITPISSNEVRKRGKEFMIMTCCGVTHCRNCTDKSIEFMSGPDRAKCYNCREPLRDTQSHVKHFNPNEKRHWMLHDLAEYYLKKKKNFKKAMKLYQRAADLGNVNAQDELAVMYYFGQLGATKCLDKARHYAEQAANQGNPNGQYILARLLILPDEHYEWNEEAIRLLTLASFQGFTQCGYDLGHIYEKRYLNMIPLDEAWRKNVLLSLYWYGKGAELEVNDPRTQKFKSLARMAFHLDAAMTLLWHPQFCFNNGSLPGYSHLPFYTWALAKAGQHTGGEFNVKNSRLLDNHAWKNKCANCGKKSRVTQELKACARCNAFNYCSKKCQVEHWKAGHKVDCKGHWIEDFFPGIRNTQE